MPERPLLYLRWQWELPLSHSLSVSLSLRLLQGKLGVEDVIRQATLMLRLFLACEGKRRLMLSAK